MRKLMAENLKQHAYKSLSKLENEIEAIKATDLQSLSDLEVWKLQEGQRILEGIARGEKAILAGEVFTHAEAKRRLAKWLK